MNAIATVASQPIIYPVTKDLLAELSKKYADVPTDLSHKDSYEYVRKACSELRGLRTKVEARRKELKADALEYGRKVDAAAKELTEGIMIIEEPLSTAKKDFDTAEEIKKREAALAEERRVNSIHERIAGIKAAVTAHISSNSAIIATAIKEMCAVSPATWADEFTDHAMTAISDATAKLTELLHMKEQQEHAEAIRKREEVQRAKEEEERRVREEEERKAAQARIDEENRRLAEERRQIEEEKEQLRKEQEEKDAAARAEKERLQKEIEALKKAAEPSPQLAPVTAAPPETPAPVTAAPSEQYRAAGNAMLRFIGNKMITKALLDAIIDGQIPHITYAGA